MNNDSPFFPFSLPGDSLFDSDHDGKLGGFESAIRDGVLLANMQDNVPKNPRGSGISYASVPAPAPAVRDNPFAVEDIDEEENDKDDDEAVGFDLSGAESTFETNKFSAFCLMGDLDIIADQLDALADEVQDDVWSAENNPAVREEMEAFCDKIREAVDSINDAVDTLGWIDL